MAIGAPRICTYPGCNAKVKGGSRCQTHPYEKPGKAERSARKLRERARGVARRRDKEDNYHFYNSRRWRKLAKWFLRANPLCEECRRNSRTTAAQMVDHIEPISVGGSPYDVQNLQSLCTACHTGKTNRERGRGV